MKTNRNMKFGRSFGEIRLFSRYGYYRQLIPYLHVSNLYVLLLSYLSFGINKNVVVVVVNKNKSYRLVKCESE